MGSNAGGLARPYGADRTVPTEIVGLPSRRSVLLHHFGNKAGAGPPGGSSKAGGDFVAPSAPLN